MPLIHQVYADNKIGAGLPTPSFYTNNKINWAEASKYITSTLVFISAIACLFFMIWGGIGMITSGGDKSKFETGRNRLIYAVIGMIVVGSAYAIWRVVMTVVGMSQLNTGVL